MSAGVADRRVPVEVARELAQRADQDALRGAFLDAVDEDLGGASGLRGGRSCRRFGARADDLVVAAEVAADEVRVDWLIAVRASSRPKK